MNDLQNQLPLCVCCLVSCCWRFEYQTDHLRHTLSLIYHYRTFILWYLYYINDIYAYLPYNATYRVHYFFICVSNCLHLVVIITYQVYGYLLLMSILLALWLIYFSVLTLFKRFATSVGNSLHINELNGSIARPTVVCCPIFWIFEDDGPLNLMLNPFVNWSAQLQPTIMICGEWVRSSLHHN